LHSNRGAAVRFHFVETFRFDRLRERRDGAPMVYRRLGALGLDLVENPGELGDLLLGEPELVGQKPQRSPHTEASAGRQRRGVLIGCAYSQASRRKRRPASSPPSQM
jgi:hypothetical protein